jgi:serine/threonine-protein kinase HipA
MGRNKKVQILKVYLREKYVGTLTKKTTGAIEFAYSNEWIASGFSISVSLPLALRVFLGHKASFYFDNLLPDNKNILDTIARKFGAESIAQFDLLNAIGRDCVGALTFFGEDEKPVFLKKMKVKKIDDHSIAERIKHLAADNPLGMDDGSFRLSLAGAQEKMALLKWKDVWYEPREQTPTSHIIKKNMGMLAGNIDFTKSIEVEWLCLYLAKQFCISACDAEIVDFDDQRVLVVTRFDREWKDNYLERIPQEDFCQALGISPNAKYERDGGPGMVKMMDLLLYSNNSMEDREQLFKTMMFNDLIFNTDGHAKNCSIFLTKAGYILTPMYDLLSAHFMRESHPERYESLRSSLSVNGKFRYKEIFHSDWRIEAEKCNLPENTFLKICEELNTTVNSLDEIIKKIDSKIDKRHLKLIASGIYERSKQILMV